MMDPQTDPSTSEKSKGSTGIDQILGDIQGYIKNPATATKDTLTQLYSDVEGLKPFLDMGEESDDQGNGDGPEPKGIAITISHAMKKGEDA